MSNKNIVLEFKNVIHTYFQGNSCIEVLKNINFILPRNCIIGIIGNSGSGKSTFLQLAGLLETVQKGNVIINATYTEKLQSLEKTKIRRNHIGYVYQKIHLLPEFNALENIIIPQRLLGKNYKSSKKKAMEFLSMMKLTNRSMHRPSSLSGGEQQRVAIARALINNPDLIIADEPTGNLDSDSSEIVTNLLFESLRKTKSSALIATHSEELSKKVDIVYKIDKGKLYKI